MASPPIAPKIRTVFTVWANQVAGTFDVLESDLIAKITSMRALGIADDEIFRRLETSLNNGMDLFGTFRGRLEKLMDDMTSGTAQLTSNAGYDAQTLLVWSLDPEAQEHCPDCLAFAADDAKTFEDWEAIGLPGMGNTECGSYCKCTLSEE